MDEISYIKCELKYGTGNHKIEMRGNVQELSFISVLITNHLRTEYLKAGMTEEFIKELVIGGIEKFWGDPDVGGGSENHENLYSSIRKEES